MFVLAALAGCVRTEQLPAPDREISFTVASYQPAITKGTLESQGVTSFNTKAYLHAEGYESVTQDFFGVAGETITKQDSYWYPSHPYYWPKSNLSYVNFVSWYDKNGSGPTSVSETRMDWTNRTIAHNDDIMYADEAWRFFNDSPSVPVLFHHALAQVKFQARLSEASEGGTSWTVTISNLQVSNVHKTGSLSLYNSDPATSYTNNAWTNAAGNAAPVWTQTEAVDTLRHVGSYTLDASTKVLMNTRTVLPQSTFGMVLSFDYTINTTYSQNNPIHSVSESATASINLYNDFRIYTWDMNTRITYTIVINPKTNKITFDPCLAESWNNDPDNSMYIE